MPHCLIEAAREVSELINPQELVQLVHDQAAESGLFQPGEVKVRLSLYEHHCVGGEPGSFVHLIFYVLAGRSDDDKRALSRRIVRALVQRLPQVPAISLDVRDIRREVFSNRRNCLDD
ncbi:MAG: 5-carboxymethyl-2-hydroxymuconate isomerase [Pseudomonas sp.]|mgnify:FL=1|uniref:5-carboxymethyl-2-hydroxymuconate isomerase n=1 Tax=Ectopseudomonas composti TaxID=658457 RepID=A0A1I5NE12_9GAMM|nr:5-carboxymethyl-2-hydroxymuconate isomerase [Pseudomonas composti]EZH77469.1 5-carboxymethyl-2-hydroxymuconate isomerase [Pseudomonas composti]MDN5517320.1 5-carboxymethyl-2-hydroxymuconate isomerase [Pseudomonas sp.]SFP20009.1 5-carboxymethyl-2-hydroxymuconate isomerase [Pseudomonas composti]